MLKTFPDNRMVPWSVCWAASLAAAAFIAAGAHAQNAAPSVTPPAVEPAVDKTVYEVETSLKDITARVVRIQRVAPDRVAMLVQLLMDPKASSEFFVPEGFTGRDPETGEKFDPSLIYSLKDAFFADPKTGTRYPVTAEGKGDPYFGSNTFSGSVSRGGGAQLGVFLKVPPPAQPAAPGQAAPLVKLALLLPGAAKPIKDVLIPNGISQKR